MTSESIILPKYRSEMTVSVQQEMGSDESIVQAMLVSSGRSTGLGGLAGRLSFLMRERHGSPFEHGSMTFYIEAPIFVFREFHRHRAGWSYNERSGRYSELDPVFYLPSERRPLQQVGKAAEYALEPGTRQQRVEVNRAASRSYSESWEAYRRLLDAGVAKEVARIVLPVATYSSMHATCNPRSLMHFLELRTERPNARFPSHPQREIAEVADQMEAAFAARFPLTHAAFEENGRVAP